MISGQKIVNRMFWIYISNQTSATTKNASVSDKLYVRQCFLGTFDCGKICLGAALRIFCTGKISPCWFAFLDNLCVRVNHDRDTFIWRGDALNDYIIERVSAPDESVPIMIDAYAEIVEESEPAGRNLSCTEDTQCRSEADFTAIESAEKALAYIQFIADGSIFSCSGGLITDVNPEHTIYYLLTANHCFSTQQTASTAEYFFDYKSQSCNGFVPSLNLLPKVS